MKETVEYVISEEDLFTKLAKTIVLYDANEKFLALSQDEKSAEIYGFPKKVSDKEIKYEVKFPKRIIDLKLNPNNLNILLAGNKSQVELFIIPEDPEEKNITKPRFVFDKNKFGFQFSLFNPKNSHIIASSCYDHSIQIWSVSRQIIHTISSEYIKELIDIMKWHNNGKLLGFIDNTQIKIYNNTNKKIIFNLDFKENFINFEFYGDYHIIFVQNEEKNEIYTYEFGLDSKEEVEIKEKKDYTNLFVEKYNHFLVFNSCYIIQKAIEDKKSKRIERISLYDALNNKAFNNDCSLNHPKVIKTADSRISFKILDKDDYNNFKLVTIKELSEEQIKELSEEQIKEEKKQNKEDKEEKSSSSSFNSFDKNSEDLNKEYFDDCPNIFIDIIDNLHFNYNKYNDTYKKNKKYLDIDEIQINLEKNKNYDLIWLRNNVKQILEKEKKYPTKFGSTKEEYIFYLNLLIQDETNIELLEKYLIFLKKNEGFLEKENIQYEKFSDELKYYSVFFEKEKLKNLFSEYKFDSEKTKLINLINAYYTNLKNNTLKQLQKQLEKENAKRYFNQPISLKSKELLYYDCYQVIFSHICESNNKNNLENELYALNEIITRKIFEKYENDDILVPLSGFIAFSEPQENVEFFLNSVCSGNLTDEEIKKNPKGLELLLFNNKGNNYVYYNNEVFHNPNQLCLKNIKCDRPMREKYNYNYMINNPPLNLNIDKIKKFVTKSFSSRVFKEAFEALIGKEDYNTIFNGQMISEFVNNMKFLPVKFSSCVAFIERLSLVSIIPTMKKNIVFSKNKSNEKEISSILENGIEISIIYHEFGHAINVVISFKENKLKSNDTPRKKYVKFREGGYYLELLLFGRVIKELTYGEALYILNEKNYSKSLEEFRKGFNELKEEDLIIEGEFKDFNIKDVSEINQLKSSIFIKIKNNNNPKDDLRNIKISIPLRNDVIGRKIKEEDLEPYFKYDHN